MKIMSLVFFGPGGGFVAVSMVWTLIKDLFQLPQPPLAVVVASFLGTVTGVAIVIATAVKIGLGQ